MAKKKMSVRGGAVEKVFMKTLTQFGVKTPGQLTAVLTTVGNRWPYDEAEDGLRDLEASSASLSELRNALSKEGGTTATTPAGISAFIADLRKEAQKFKDQLAATTTETERLKLENDALDKKIEHLTNALDSMADATKEMAQAICSSE